MKKTKLLLGLCALSLLGKAQPFTGITRYDHAGDNAVLSSGTITSNSPGFLMGAYTPTISPAGFNLFVDKTNVFGLFGPPPEFSAGYQVFASSPCAGTASQLSNCYGASVIETNQPPNQYMLAATFDIGYGVTALDGGGNVLPTSFFFLFPTTATQPSRALITESASNPGYYYVVTSYLESSTNTRHMCVALIDGSGGGSVCWSNIYDIGPGTSLEPTAILESPFTTTPQLVVAGTADPSNPSLNREGFIMDITGNCTGIGSVNNFYLIGTPSSSMPSNEEFHSIFPVTGTGYYLLGGYTDVNTTAGTSWMLSFNPTLPSFGAINSQILPGTPGGDGPVVGVLHRNSPIFGDEYYGTVRSSAGSVVLKLDANGLGSATPSEFLYNPSAPTISEPAGITHINIAGDMNEGIHVYGTDRTTFGGGETTLIQGFYNGTSGTCTDVNPSIQFTTNISSVTNGPNSLNPTPVVNIQTGTGNCTNHLFSGTNLTYAPTQLCPFTGNPPGPYAGSNARPAVTTGIPQQNLNTGQISIQPNPVQETLTLRYALSSQQPVKIEIFNALGQRVKAFDQPSQAGENQMNIDFNHLGVESGIYFIHTTIGQSTDKQKVIYRK
jgi:hypothetical protein